MATRKVLSQTRPSGASLTDSYTVPAATSTVISSLTVVETSGAADTFRISVAVAGAVDGLVQYIYYDLPITANDTFIATVGITLAATDVIRVYSANGTCSFNFFGEEI